eukprot:7050017-Prymnesium_polylepis.2
MHLLPRQSTPVATPVLDTWRDAARALRRYKRNLPCPVRVCDAVQPDLDCCILRRLTLALGPSSSVRRAGGSRGRLSDLRGVRAAGG